MYNKILWTLDNEMSSGCFERLCTDILSREGYKDIVHIGGTHDHGRDAELKLYKGHKITGGITFFQYSLDKKWESKFYREIEKVNRYNHEIDFYVFMSSQKISGEKRDKLSEEIYKLIECNLIIYDREWLRHRLEEVHPDISMKYFGISPKEFAKIKQDELKPAIPENLTFEKVWQLYHNKEYERASIEIKELLKSRHKSNSLWAMLAWSQYCLYRYNEALASINKALEFEKNDINSLAVKACILAEEGIDKGIKANLLISKQIFTFLSENIDRWVDHYNLGNTLSALGEYKTAEKEYLKSIKKNPGNPEIWKNLGSVYFHLKKHKREIECYDKALSLNPYLKEALISKAVTSLVIYNESRRCVQLIEKALKYDESIILKWPHVFYWLTKAYYNLTEFEEALRSVDLGLSQVPNHIGLLDLKSLILSKLWRSDSEFIETSIAFFSFRVELSDKDYDSFCELMHLFNEIGEEDRIYREINSYINFEGIDFTKYLKYMNHTYEEYLLSFKYYDLFKKYRSISPIDLYIEFMNKHSLDLDKDFHDGLLIICSVPFGLSCDILSKELKKRKITSLKKVYNTIQKSLGFSFPQISKKLVKGFKKNTANEIATSFADRIVSISFVSLIELSRQFGFLGGMFGVEQNDLDYILAKKIKSPANWQGSVVSDSFFEMNKELGIFKE